MLCLMTVKHSHADRLLPRSSPRQRILRSERLVQTLGDARTRHTVRKEPPAVPAWIFLLPSAGAAPAVLRARTRLSADARCRSGGRLLRSQVRRRAGRRTARSPRRAPATTVDDIWATSSYRQRSLRDEGQPLPAVRAEYTQRESQTSRQHLTRTDFSIHMDTSSQRSAPESQLAINWALSDSPDADA